MKNNFSFYIELMVFALSEVNLRIYSKKIYLYKTKVTFFGFEIDTTNNFKSMKDQNWYIYYPGISKLKSRTKFIFVHLYLLPFSGTICMITGNTYVKLTEKYKRVLLDRHRTNKLWKHHVFSFDEYKNLFSW